MKKWNFKVESSPGEVVKKLDSALKSVGSFVFKKDQDEKKSLVFNFRKRVKYPDQILHRNRIIVNGKLLEAGVENETDVEINFTQHFFMTITVVSIVISGLALITIISKVSSGASIYILGGLVLVIGALLWLALQKKFEKDISDYKTLISGILESKKIPL